jgi:hypothetical protein
MKMQNDLELTTLVVRNNPRSWPTAKRSKTHSPRLSASPKARRPVRALESATPMMTHPLDRQYLSKVAAIQMHVVEEGMVVGRARPPLPRLLKQA